MDKTRSREWNSASVNSIEVQTGHSLEKPSNLGSLDGQLKRGEFIPDPHYRIFASLSDARLEQSSGWRAHSEDYACYDEAIGFASSVDSSPPAIRERASLMVSVVFFAAM